MPFGTNVELLNGIGLVIFGFMELKNTDNFGLEKKKCPFEPYGLKFEDIDPIWTWKETREKVKINSSKDINGSKPLEELYI